MEESGHYYTVYFVALAVGYSKQASKEYAFYAQMPDEVENLDAVHLEKKQVKLTLLKLLSDSIASKPVRELVKSITASENQWRMMVELGLHSLTGFEAKIQQEKTKSLLRSTSTKDVVRFGFLLHRLGDTYAHTWLENPEMLYRTDSSMIHSDRGHGKDGTHPDHPWEREDVYFKYVDELYSIFIESVKHPDSKLRMRNGKPLSVGDAKEVLRLAIVEARKYSEKIIVKQGVRVDSLEVDFNLCKIRPLTGVSFTGCTKPEEEAQVFFSEVIRREIYRLFEIVVDEYTPENNGLISLDAFIQKYNIKDRNGARISSEKIVTEVTKIYNETKSPEQ